MSLAQTIFLEHLILHLILRVAHHFTFQFSTFTVKKIQEFDVIQFLFKPSSIFQRFDCTTVILKEKMLNEKSTQPFNILHQSNLRK